MGRLSLGSFFLIAVWAAVVPAAPRVALVVGNAKYETQGTLENAGNDADAMAEALAGLDFKVIKKKELDKEGMDNAMVEFYRALPKEGMAMFFYAGHGLQVSGENYLVPVKAKIQEEFQVERQCLPVGEVLRALQQEEGRVNVVVLDCCRDNPFSRSWSRSTAQNQKGLAAITKPPEGTLIAFATAPGKVASDGPRQGNSPYSQALVRVLRSRPEQGLELLDAFFEASREVKRSSGQTPWLHLDASIPKFTLWRPSTPGVSSSKPQTPVVTSVPKPQIPVTPSLPKREDPVPVSLPKETTNSIGMKLVLIPAGEFMMGSWQGEIKAWNEWYKQDLKDTNINDEGPQHRVRITRPFYLGGHHVTRGQFRQFASDAGYQTDAEKGTEFKGAIGWDAEKKMPAMNEKFSWRNPGFEQTDDHPVVCVSWNDAVAFCQWLSRKEGRSYRLPTEAEWEYACRAGTTTRWWCGDDQEKLAEVANVADATAKAKLSCKFTINASDGYVFTSPVGSFRPNPFGLYDMHGNAGQWCADWYGERYYDTSPADNPEGPRSGTVHVHRGGTFQSKPCNTRSAHRSWTTPAKLSFSLGFRIARTP